MGAVAKTSDSATARADTDLQPTGIAAIGAVPGGMRLCQLHTTKEDLADALVRFQVGLERNELCWWVTSPALAFDEAWQRLAQAVPDLHSYRYRERGLIDIPEAHIPSPRCRAGR